MVYGSEKAEYAVFHTEREVSQHCFLFGWSENSIIDRLKLHKTGRVNQKFQKWQHPFTDTVNALFWFSTTLL